MGWFYYVTTLLVKLQQWAVDCKLFLCWYFYLRRRYPTSSKSSMTPHFLSFTPIFASISPHRRYSHSSQTMSIVHLDCCRSFLTELLDFLLTSLPSLFHTEDKRENMNQIMSCLHTILQFIPIVLKGRKSNFLLWTQGRAFPALVHLSNLMFDFSLFCLFLIFLILAKLISDSWLPPACSLRLAVFLEAGLLSFNS